MLRFGQVQPDRLSEYHMNHPAKMGLYYAQAVPRLAGNPSSPHCPLVQTGSPFT